MPPRPRNFTPKPSKKEDKKRSGDVWLDRQKEEADNPDSIGRILYDVFFPRLPDEGFFGPLNLPYVTAQGAKNLKKYKYNAIDNSPIYKFVLSPIAEFLVSFVPISVAPNLITLVAMILSISSHAVIAYYSWDFTQDVPPWVWLFNALILIAYQTLDNMDGKQARRTNTSSPLGMLFDHGCDAFNTGLLSMNILALHQFGTEPAFACASYFFCLTTFMFSTWEEFFSGSLSLPAVNGPTEGILIAAIMCLVAFFLGKNHMELWLSDFFGLGVTVRIMIFSIFLVAAVVSVMFSVRAVVNADNRKLRLRDAFGALMPIIFGHILTFIIIYVPDTSLFLAYPRILLSLLGLMFANLAIHLQLAHIQSMTFYPWRKTFFLPLLVLTCNAFLRYFDIHLVDPGNLLYVCFAGAFLSSVQFICRVVVEVAGALDISVFTIPPTKKGK
eukprot:GEMP01010941.1.p1 GENE.GEMP01010941.1~~GEMP01010941.1.p1  ORF type:complete len:442 (+),score=52.30 GEMP01010941.1:68-1393(+)